MSTRTAGFNTLDLNQLRSSTMLVMIIAVLIVMLTIFVVQFVFVTFGGEFLSVMALNPQTWLILLGLSFMVIPIDIIRKVLTKKKA